MWKIDRDYLGGETSRVGIKTANFDPKADNLIRFRCKDDDGNIYYGGVLSDDDRALAQDSALNWCRNDAGCTTIEVKRDGVWVQEIG